MVTTLGSIELLIWTIVTLYLPFHVDFIYFLYSRSIFKKNINVLKSKMFDPFPSTRNSYSEE